jgi:hypothetical protein
VELLQAANRAGLTVIETTQAGDILRDRLRGGVSARVVFKEGLKVVKSTLR